MAIVYDVATAIVTAMMVGTEFAVAAFVHPQIKRLSDKAHAPAASVLAASLGRFMPPWYALSLLLILGAAFEHRPLTTGPGLLIAVAAILWAVAILFSITKLVPINNRIARMDPEQPHQTWLQDRCRWDKFHRTRVTILTISLILLLTGLFQSAAAN